MRVWVTTTPDRSQMLIFLTEEWGVPAGGKLFDLPWYIVYADALVWYLQNKVFNYCWPLLFPPKGESNGIR